MQFQILTHTGILPSMTKNITENKPARPNGLLRLMARDSVSAADIARAWSVENGDASQRVNGKVGITNARAKILQRKFGWSLSEIYGEDINPQIPILYKIGAGAKVYPINDHEVGAAFEHTELPPGVEYSDSMCAFRVDGDSQAPMLYDGWLVFAKKKTEGGCEDLASKVMHIVQIKDGPCMLKLIRRGYSAGKYNLRSHNADDIDDINIEWCAKIEAIVPK